MSVTSEGTQDYVGRAHSGGKDAAFDEIRVALAVGAAGVLIAIGGAIAFAIRVKLAEVFLGAHLWFNVPVTETDALKLLFMTIQSLGTLAWGGVTAGVAFVFAVVKWTQANAGVGRRQS